MCLTTLLVRFGVLFLGQARGLGLGWEFLNAGACMSLGPVWRREHSAGPTQHLLACQGGPPFPLPPRQASKK